MSIIYDFARINLIEFSNIDSSQMSLVMLNQLARLTQNILSDTQTAGVIITHGTDTLSESAYYLSLMISADKPVILTGAMRIFSDPDFDGTENLINSIKQILSSTSVKAGVTVNLNGQIFLPKYIQKTNTKKLNAFSNTNNDIFDYMCNNFVVFNKEIQQQHCFSIPKDYQLPRVALIKTFLDDDGSIIRLAVENNYDGLVIEALGSGNVSHSVYQAICYALKERLFVVLTTQVNTGGVLPIYGCQGGGATLKKAGVINAGKIPGNKARLLLVVTLSNHIYNKDEIQKVFMEFQ